MLNLWGGGGGEVQGVGFLDDGVLNNRFKGSIRDPTEVSVKAVL